MQKRLIWGLGLGLLGGGGVRVDATIGADSTQQSDFSLSADCDIYSPRGLGRPARAPAREDDEGAGFVRRGSGAPRAHILSITVYSMILYYM